jgi:hypothetical protein
MSDNTATTVPFHSTNNTSEQIIISEAKKSMAAKLLAFEDTFNQPVVGKA